MFDKLEKVSIFTLYSIFSKLKLIKYIIVPIVVWLILNDIKQNTRTAS